MSQVHLVDELDERFHARDSDLGVNVPGALFSLGDGHARQGEGETCGVAVECAMDTYQLLSQAVESPLANVCDSNYTSLAKVAER